MNYYKRHIGDYTAATAHLTLIEHGAYAKLLDIYYIREGGIPDSQAERLCGARTHDEKNALRSVLKEFFELVDPKNPNETHMVSALGILEPTWVQMRCEKELKSAQEKAESNQKNGKKGGRPRKKMRKPISKDVGNAFDVAEKTQMVSENNPSDNPNETQHEPKNNPNPLIHQSIKEEESPPPPLQLEPPDADATGRRGDSSVSKRETFLHALDAEFERWWKAYPRKVGKDAARKAWFSAVRKEKATCSTLLERLKAWPFPADPQFQPHPATWLNQARWLDEPAPKTAETAPKAAKMRPWQDYDPRYFAPHSPQEIAELPEPPPGTWEKISWGGAQQGWPTDVPPTFHRAAGTPWTLDPRWPRSAEAGHQP